MVEGLIGESMKLTDRGEWMEAGELRRGER